MMAVNARAQETRLSRSDLGELKQRDRAGVFAALRSFDHRGLSRDAFIRNALELLDPERVPGLSEAMQSGDQDQALQAVLNACGGDQPVPPTAAVSPAVIRAADEILQHRFTFYGETHQLPETIDWEHNPGTKHWGHDLNRFTFLRTLVRAYLGTRDPKYGRKAVTLILDWIEQCDTAQCFQGSPYMWGSYLNNAIHCKAWCEELRPLIADGQTITPGELLTILKSLHDQLAYLEIVTNGHSGNWPTIGMRGILGCTAAFPVLRDTDRFADYCTEELTAQIADQVLPDGVQYELTPHYHRVVISNLLDIVRNLRKLGRDLDPETLATLRKMLHYMQQTTVPDGGKQVAFNDSDPASAGRFDPVLAELGLSEMLSPPELLGPEIFPYAGVALLRQRQDVGDLYLAFDAGPFGKGHQHEDKLGFWLFAYGRNLLVDPGRHLYDWSEQSYYPYLRSTAAHSTIRIDGHDQHSRGRPDTWVATEPIDLGWDVRDGRISAQGAYELGYGPDNAVAAVHRRAIVFVQERCWIVFDRVEGAGDHTIESRFQFAPGDLRLDDQVVTTQFSDANLMLQCASAEPLEMEIQKGQNEPRRGWYSDSYNKITPAPALAITVRTALPWQTATLLLPYRGTERPTAGMTWDGDSATLHSIPGLPERVIVQNPLIGAKP